MSRILKAYVMTADVFRISQSAENNKDVILQQLQNCLPDSAHVLEIASGTGQHAIHFSRNIPGIVWQSSDVNLSDMDLQSRLAAEGNEGVREAKVLDVDKWPEWAIAYDAVYSANCVHIISASQVENYVAGAATVLKSGGLMLLYGPFKYDGQFTTDSNEAFDGFLRKTYPGGCIKDFGWLNDLAHKAGMTFVSDTPMPSNNQFLIWRKGEAQ